MAAAPVDLLKAHGQAVNRKRVQRLMGIWVRGHGAGTATMPHPEHTIFPFGCAESRSTRPNQVWSTEITYVRLAPGFAYWVAIVDGYARRVRAWRLSNTLDAGFCVDCLEEALRAHGRPEIFNTDQGAPFTSAAFTGVL